MSKIIKCKICGEIKEHYSKEMCESCYNKKWRNENKEYLKKLYQENKEYYKEYCRKYSYAHGGLSMSENRSCATFLGVHVAEQVLSKVFKNVQQMPNGNPGFDFKCNKGMKVDVKSSVLHVDKRYKNSQGYWIFSIKKNTTADYFLCLAFDNREDLNPLHIWLIPGKEVNHLVSTSISKSTLSKWKKYEKDIDKVVNCCDSMKK